MELPKGMSADARAVLQEAVEAGWTWQPTRNGHLRLLHSDGEHAVTMSPRASRSNRGVQNTLAQIRGVEPTEPPTEPVETPRRGRGGFHAGDYYCPVCGKHFTSAAGKGGHMKVHRDVLHVADAEVSADGWDYQTETTEATTVPPSDVEVLSLLEAIISPKLRREIDRLRNELAAANDATVAAQAEVARLVSERQALKDML